MAQTRPGDDAGYRAGAGDRAQARPARSVEAVRDMLRRHAQEHLLQFYDELSEAQQAVLLKQIDAIDFDALDALIAEYVLRMPAVAMPTKVEPPQVVPARPRDEAARRLHDRARRAGCDLLAQGKVAAFVVAGGQGTRLGWPGPKGCIEATPVTHKPLFQVFAEQIRAAGRRAGRAVPWYVMTSPSNDVATRAFFRGHDYFGLDADDVFFLVQGTMPAIGLDGKVLLADKGSLALSPNGHGGCLSALRDSGALEDIAARGVELISYFQVDNPLTRCVDPLFIGLHAVREAEMSAKCLPKRDPLEKLGNFCVVDGKVRVIEYSDLPEALARATTDDGHLRFWAGSIAIHVLSRSFVQRLTDGRASPLPYHRAEKKVACVDPGGRTVEPDEPNAVKLEMFVFDAMPLAERCAILQTRRDEEFSPVKNAEGPDSLASSLHDQIRRAAAWLEEAGVSVPRDAEGQVAAAIEISPLLAEDAAELTEKLRQGACADVKITPGQSVYLGE